MTAPRTGWCGVAALLLTLSWTAGCSPYQLQGVVIEGDVPGVELVGKRDPRLERFGLPGAELELWLDPDRLRPRRVGRAVTDADGRFVLPVDAEGAGLLMLDVRLDTQRDGFASVAEPFVLPGSGSDRRVVVTMKRGEAGTLPGRENIVDQTLREAEPFLRD